MQVDARDGTRTSAEPTPFSQEPVLSATLSAAGVEGLGEGAGGLH
jgi:hypothetical protein